ncbi:hypothetical protein P20652_0234 [Pseudoalteromonas sp. BSi20652]|nr:hypothetical protein P20652_0234 [Pseudoalteromonas sp. BSi20652]
MNDYLPLNKGVILNLIVPICIKLLLVLPINQVKTPQISCIYSIKVN